MIELVPCGNAERHDGHRHEVVVAVACSGLTRCGAHVHPPHHFDEQQNVYCPGVCDCGLGRGAHGPGEHK